MAQSDIFDKFVRVGGELDNLYLRGIVNLRERKKILEEVYQNEVKIADINRRMLTSEDRRANVFKQISSVAKKIAATQRELADQSKKIKVTDEVIAKNKAAISKAQIAGRTQEAALLKKINKQLEYQNAMAKVTLDQARRTVPLFGRMGKIGAFLSDSFFKVSDTLAMIGNTIGFIFKGLFKIGKFLVNMFLAPIKKAFQTLMEFQNVIGNLSADIGLAGSEFDGLNRKFFGLTLSAMKFGGTMKDVATVFQTFSEQTGKNRFFDPKEIASLVELGLGTKLGVEGATEIAAKFDNIGISLSKTIKLTEKARKLAAKMGINSTTLLKNYSELVKGLTGMNFSRGLDNLTKLAAKAAALRFDIVESSKSFKDAFFEPEKAVEAAAKIQVLGGQYAAAFGDPMQLAFESMTSPELLAERLQKSISGIVSKSSTGMYFIPAAERKRLKLVADALGQNYEMLVDSAIEQRKVADKMVALNKQGIMLANEEDQIAIANLMKLNEKGQFEIQMPDGTSKLLSSITDKNAITAMLAARKKDEDAAIQRLNLMQRLGLIVDRFMAQLAGVLNKFLSSKEGQAVLAQLEDLGSKVGNFITSSLLGQNGLFKWFGILMDEASKIFATISQLFNENNSLSTALIETAKILFKDVGLAIIEALTPVLKSGFGYLIHSIGEAIPDLLGGKRLRNVGLEMQAQAIEQSGQNSILRDIYSTKDVKDPVSHIRSQKEETNGSFFQGATSALKATATATKSMGSKIPLLGAGVSGYMAYQDFKEGDIAGGLLNTLSGLANVANLFFPGIGSAVSIGLDSVNAGREMMGTFNDGVIYKDGSYAKFSKGDMVQFIDQAAMERAQKSTPYNTNSGSKDMGVITHTGTIILKSEDGKVVTWDQMYKARDLVGKNIESLSNSNQGGFGNYNNPNKAPIKPIL
jgi:hypothetical protein